VLGFGWAVSVRTWFISAVSCVRPCSITEIRESIVFKVLKDRLELSLARELALDSVVLATSLSVSMALVEGLRFFLVCTVISPGRGRFDPSVKVCTNRWWFLYEKRSCFYRFRFHLWSLRGYE
jgi:hypothetical protein